MHTNSNRRIQNIGNEHFDESIEKKTDEKKISVVVTWENFSVILIGEEWQLFMMIFRSRFSNYENETKNEIQLLEFLLILGEKSKWWEWWPRKFSARHSYRPDFSLEKSLNKQEKNKQGQSFSSNEFTRRNNLVIKHWWDFLSRWMSICLFWERIWFVFIQWISDGGLEQNSQRNSMLVRFKWRKWCWIRRGESWRKKTCENKEEKNIVE